MIIATVTARLHWVSAPMLRWRLWYYSDWKQCSRSNLRLQTILERLCCFQCRQALTSLRSMINVTSYQASFTHNVCVCDDVKVSIEVQLCTNNVECLNCCHGTHSLCHSQTHAFRKNKGFRFFSITPLSLCSIVSFLLVWKNEEL